MLKANRAVLQPARPWPAAPRWLCACTPKLLFAQEGGTRGAQWGAQGSGSPTRSRSFLAVFFTSRL